MLIAALIHHPAVRARLTAAVRDRAEIRYCVLTDELRLLAGEAGICAVIAEPRDRDERPTWPTLAVIRESVPTVPLIAFCSVQPALSHQIVEMVRAGADELVIRDLDDSPHRWRAMLSRARATRTAGWARGELAPLVPGIAWPAFEYCLQNAARALTVEELASSTGMHRKTLFRQFLRAGMPAPSIVIAWSRLLVAAVLLEERGRPLDQIALELDFPSGGALRSMLSRYTRLRPGEVRENGGGRCILSAFKAALRAARRSAPEPLVPVDLETADAQSKRATLRRPRGVTLA